MNGPNSIPTGPAIRSQGRSWRGAGAPLIVAWAGGGRHGYMVMGLIIGTIMSTVFLVTFSKAREPARPEFEPVPTIRDTIAAIGSNRPFAVLFGAYFLNITSGGLYGAVLAYFVTYGILRNESFISVLFFVIYGSSFISVPLWGWISRKTGKLLALQVSIALTIFASMGFLFIMPITPVAVILAVVFVQGLSGGGVQVMATSMLADCISEGDRRPDAAAGSAAMFNGVFIAGEKLGFATGALLSGIILSAAGLIATTQGSVAQPASAVVGIRFALSWMPAALNSAGVALLMFYRPFERKLLADLRAAEVL